MSRLATLTVIRKLLLPALILASLSCSGSRLTIFHDPNMDFAALQTIAVMPFENLSRDRQGAERVRDIFANSLRATGAVYVIPSGEVARGIARAGVLNPAVPSLEEIGRLASIIKTDAVITGTVTEYGEVRSGSASANVISLNVEMIEVQTKRVVWTASSTQGGISIWDRLFGSGGEPLNTVTMAAINDIIEKLFQ